MSLTAAKGCSGVRGAFGNLFAQIDFLCKRLGMSATERQELQTARRHSNGNETIAADEWGYDVRAAALFISRVFAVDVPSSLRRLLPPTARPHQRAAVVNKRYIRCIVNHHDDSTIWADTADGEITVDYGNTDQGRDFAYLRKILRPGMQLNLLDCHVDSGITAVLPGVIIVEPDFLIDISSLAACFTAYGHHTLLYTLNRLSPKPNSQAILMGNFAGVVLDETVHSSPSPSSLSSPFATPTPAANTATTMNSALKRAFREDVLRYCACPDFNPEKFKREAMQQVKNIEEAVDILKNDVKTKGGFLLEPSFVCESLGLQGRVDLMATDMTLLVEQKAGKNMKIEHQSRDNHGLQLESHYVQLLLYYAILRYNFQKSDSQVDIRLLYSRYEAASGLLSVNYYRTLLREALKLRNQIVATELLIARDGFGRIVPLLNADIIYKDVARDGFFHSYILPPLTAINTQLSTLSTLERTYVERMMTSVYREQLSQKLGGGSQRLQHSGGAASDLWLMPLSEKQETGNIYLDLTITDTRRSSPDAGLDIITLCPASCSTSTVPPVSNFRRGDMVYLYQYAEIPDVRRSILYKGTLDTIGDNSLTVLLNDGQQNASIFNNNRPWAIEHGGSDTTTSGCIRSLFSFATAAPSRRALLLGQREPQADTRLQLTRNYNPHYDDILLRIHQARDYFLLVGPPGTGKTSMALRFIVEEELNATVPARTSAPTPTNAATVPVALASGPAPSILLTAYTNRAVDEICSMLTDAGIGYLRIGSPSSCDPRYASHLLSELPSGPLGSSESKAPSPTPTLDSMRSAIENTPVIVATTSMLLARPFIFDLKHFSLAVVDEASQILEPGLIGILANDSIDRFVLVGDYKQLPAVVQQDEADTIVEEPCLRGIGLTDCRNSLFQRLYQWELSQGRSQFVAMLSHQGRMHPDVAAFASQRFYDGKLMPVPLSHQKDTTLGYTLPSEDGLDDLLKERRVLFICSERGVKGSERGVKGTLPFGILSLNSSNYNEAEARIVADLLRRIHRFYGDRFDADKTVGVIVPYRSQIAAIRAETARLGIEALMNVSVDTVERYQGSQRDVIIYSFTVSRRYQLDFLAANTYDDNGKTIDRKLNVALTRARLQTIMVGNPKILRHNPLFMQLIDEYATESTP